MKINRRIKKGWTGNVENINNTVCDLCGSLLWEAPHGLIYCDKVHIINPFDIITHINGKKI